MKRLTALATALLLALGTGCGIAPSIVMELGEQPVINTRPSYAEVFLLKQGQLSKASLVVQTNAVDHLLKALFDAPYRRLDPQQRTALGKLRYGGSDEMLIPGRPRGPEVPRGRELLVIVNGEAELTRAGLAQIVCTAQLHSEIHKVRVTQVSKLTGSMPKGKHDCAEFDELIADRSPPPSIE